ncbi:MAG: RidA family protein [Alphaproteobacteria bacterium]
MQKRIIAAPDAPLPASAYAQALEVRGADRILFVSGQVPSTVDGTVPPDFAAQARLAWANVEAQLRAAGMTLDNLAKVTIFLADRKYAMENRAQRQAVLGDRTPALTVIVCEIFDAAWLLEIEAIAVA